MIPNDSPREPVNIPLRDLPAFPGGDLIAEGLADLTRGRVSAAALLVSIGAPRLRRCGITVSTPFASPETRLYALLYRQHGDAAHGRYNALVRRLVSFERSIESAG